MTIANKREHIKMVTWTVLDLRGLILDQAEEPGLSFIIQTQQF
jgi:hypothetical protein